MLLRSTLNRYRRGWTPPGTRLEDYPTRINLGCGYDYRPGWINVDRYAERADQRFDLFRPPYPIPAGSIDYVYAEQVLEHIPQRIGDEDGLLVVLQELHRILRPGGLLSAGVPYAGSDNDYANPTHYRHFVRTSFDFLDPARRDGHPLTPQAGIRFHVQRILIRRGFHLGKYFDTAYHLPKYLGLDPNVGRKRGLHVILQKPEADAPRKR